LRRFLMVGIALVCLLFARPLHAQKSVAASVSSPPSRVSFRNDVVPILTRWGCNQGACHGAQHGKGGLKLSLAGFDPDLDFYGLTKQARGRRVSPAEPARSLFLTKPTMTVPHGGGRRLDPNSPDYRTLLRWIKQGAAAPHDADPHPVTLSVSPTERVLPKGSPPVQVTVTATYSDKSKRDVTAHARISTLNDGVASCTPEGIVRAVNKGQTAIMVRYAGLVAVSSVIVPFQTAKDLSLDISKGNAIDKFIGRKQEQLGLSPSALCDDRTFIRRASLDLIGTPPKPEEIAAFLADKSHNKRDKLVNALLERPEYADYWALKWADLLRSNRVSLGVKGMWSFTNWIRTQFRQNRPVDEFVRELLTAQGSTFTNGPSNFYRVASNPQDLAETTSQVFLGVRIACAKCHSHPFEKWTQTDYYQFAAYFARIGIKGSDEFGLFGNEQVVRINDGGEVYHPKNGQQMKPTPLGATLAVLADGKTPDPDSNGDRRRLLAEWLTGTENKLFARNIVNRLWGYLMGRGLVNPIDDLRVTNPPTHPELLDYLAHELVKSKFNLKHVLRLIASSAAYGRSSQATADNAADDRFYTYYAVRRLPAEVLLDSIDFACGTREKFNELPLGTRAIQLPDPQVSSEFLDTFGRPPRLIACECERVPEPNLSQTLRLMNGELVNRKVSEGSGRIAKLIEAKKPDDAILNELYMVTVGRPPKFTERALVMGTLAWEPNRRAVFEDVLLTLLNSKEFLFNH
jgi:hypothetical protein